MSSEQSDTGRQSGWHTWSSDGGYSWSANVGPWQKVGFALSETTAREQAQAALSSLHLAHPGGSRS